MEVTVPLPSFADRTALEQAYGVLASPQATTHALWRVSTAIRGVTGHSWVDNDGALIDLSAVVADQLASVTIEAASRLLRNPEGATSRSETLGPFTDSVTIDAASVYFNRAERETLNAATVGTFPSSGFPGLGTISTTRGDIETQTVSKCGYVGWPDDEGNPE